MVKVKNGVMALEVVVMVVVVLTGWSGDHGAGEV